MGHPKLVMEEETNIQPGDKTAPFFLQQTSRNHPVEHEAQTSHRDVEHSPALPSPRIKGHLPHLPGLPPFQPLLGWKFGSLVIGAGDFLYDPLGRKK